MKVLEQLINLSKLYRISVKKDEVIMECLKNDIPLTNQNINEIRQIIQGREKNKNVFPQKIKK
ncbi:MAG: hypothetical protein IPL63_10090 [Saprospiraceae bacterium]|nr:hypothetical protein [Saprospiraceae bacterium]MBK6563695.1 hypothetical protein [Saprospiraceae bacterium]MBK6783720.1 hypothetical protein [Saprospiraceae bacterium]MBK7524605.1 hypothetical protein [Saprospiraceae bacterium]MBK8373069.1 hypothetical protein [Saprospiraceae bacterium]